MLLWHYTSVEVLSSILGQAKPTLRATHINYLNDSVELKHGLDAIKNILIKTHDPSVNDIVEDINELLDDNYDPHIFSFSLSEAKDSLYQWLAYCPSNGGVSLGFEFSDTMVMEDVICVKNAFELPLPNYPSSQIPQYRKCNYFLSEIDIKTDWYRPQNGKTTKANLLTNAMFLKHSAFHFEQEHRLFFHPMPNSQFYVPAKFQGSKPYVDFHFDPKILKYVCVSPRGNKDIGVKIVIKILSTYGFNHVEVIVSSIPFRE